MIDFAAARRMMVDGQVRTSDVTDLRLISVMQEIPRELFLPESKAALAYLDLDVPVTEAGNDTPLDAKDLEEFVPKGLFLRALAFDASPIAGKLDRVVADFVPGNRHGGDYASG